MYLQKTVLDPKGKNSEILTLDSPSRSSPAVELSSSQNHLITSVVGCGASRAAAWRLQAKDLVEEEQDLESGTIHLDPGSAHLPKLGAHIASV
jgi:hypothetical protein